MIDSRQKGKAFERAVAKEWGKALGLYPQRTGYAAKVWDDNKVDLTPEETAPFLIQCKAVERAKYLHDVLEDMPSPTGMYPVVVHKQNRRRWKVVLYFDDFIELVQMLKANGIL